MKNLNPTLWRTCRILANPTRLNLLRELFANGEASVAILAKQTGIPMKLASTYLRAISARGLITARADGRWVFYSACANPNVTHAITILTIIRECVRIGITNEEIIHYATAFTHQRRIEISKQLHGNSQSTPSLALETKIPTPSLHRHLNKLINRDMVTRSDHYYSLKIPNNPLGQALLQIATS